MAHTEQIEVSVTNNRIELFLEEDSWYAHYPEGNPARGRMIEMLRSATIVTAYTAKATPAEVLAAIQALNPDATVVLR